MGGSHSGLVQWFAKPPREQFLREFESLPARQIQTPQDANPAAFCCATLSSVIERKMILVKIAYPPIFDLFAAR